MKTVVYAARECNIIILFLAVKSLAHPEHIYVRCVFSKANPFDFRVSQVDVDDPSSRVQLLATMEQHESGMNGARTAPSGATSQSGKREFEYPDIRGDRLNIFMLSFLYLLQGTMFGLTQAIPIILQNRHASYEDQV